MRRKTRPPPTWGHGLGLAQYDQPVISRIWSLDHPWRSSRA